MDLELANKNTGQYFSPSAMTEMMAQLTIDDELWAKAKENVITMLEPACGAGGMLLAFVNEMITRKINPAKHCWMQCVDIDRLPALMCYVQLSLWNVPAQIIVGNSLSLKFTESWFTPAYYLNNWAWKLEKDREKEKKPQGNSTAVEKPESEDGQYDLQF